MTMTDWRLLCVFFLFSFFRRIEKKKFNPLHSYLSFPESFWMFFHGIFYHNERRVNPSNVYAYAFAYDVNRIYSIWNVCFAFDGSFISSFSFKTSFFSCLQLASEIEIRINIQHKKKKKKNNLSLTLFLYRTTFVAIDWITLVDLLNEFDEKMNY